jgi:hypothetical protein
MRNVVPTGARVKSPARTRRRLRTFGALVFAFLVSTCATCPESVVAQLYFGRGLAGGGEVDETSWAAFVDAELTPRFPDGFTVLDGAGQWRANAAHPIVRERTKLVLIAAPESAATRRKLEEIRAAYRSRFAQGAVGLVTAPACAEF